MSRWKIVEDISLYFVTTTIVNWEKVFVSIEMFETLIESLDYCITHKGLHLHGYVIMPNHAHYILSCEGPGNLSNIMRDYNRYSSQEIVRWLKGVPRHDILRVFREAAEKEGRGNYHKVWRDGFHPVAIESEPFFQEKLKYIHENPVRKGFVECPEHWKYSSARNYILDDHSVIRVECLE